MPKIHAAEPVDKPVDLTQRRRPKPRNATERVFKGMQRIRWADDADERAELAEARNSAYYWWWAFLKESRDYRRALSGRAEEPFAKMAKDFGRLGDNFDYWWLRTGREIFAEQMVLPRVRALEHGVTVNLDQINPKLVLELPLTIRRATIIRQINRLLDDHHQGAKLRVMGHGSATRKLYPDSRMRLPTLKVLYDVWMEKKQNPESEWHIIGEKLGLSPVFIPRERDKEEEIKYKRRCMTIVIQRYYRKAAALIDFAASGDFPRIK
jgi:hypothetical protein